MNEEHNNNSNSKTEWRLQQLETNFSILTGKIENIESIVIRLESKIPSGGLDCQFHKMRLDEIDKRVGKVETSTESINKKIITWSAIAAVILFLFSQVFIPYALNNYKVESTSGKPQIEYVDPLSLQLDFAKTNLYVRGKS